jgi:peptidylprolyl isomerase
VRRRLVALSILPVLLLGAAACGEDQDGSGDGSDSSSAASSIDGIEVSGEVGEAPEVKIEEALDLKETKTAVLESGDGNPAAEGKDALLHIYVANGTNGDKAVTTYDQGVPIKIGLSEDQLFKSVIDAIAGENVGSRVLVAATPADAYGDQGAPQLKLGAEDDVVFVVDIMSVEPEDVIEKPDGEAAGDLPATVPTVVEKDGTVTGIDFAKAPKSPSKKLEVVTLVEGDGPEVRDDSLVTFDYLGQVYGTQKIFDESFSSEPRTFPVGIGGLIKAWDEALVGAKRGSRLLITAPPSLAYGAKGNPPSVPANATLTFVVDVLGVDPAA